MESIDISLHKKFFEKLTKGLPEAAHSSYITTLHFIVSALDILNCNHLFPKQQLIDWVYSQQVFTPGAEGFKPNGSFGGLENTKWDYSTLASTYSALCILLVLGDDLSRVNKGLVVSSIASLQKSDGSFNSHKDGLESDMRFVYCVCSICSILDTWEGINLDKLENFILSCQSSLGSIGMGPGQEGHGGSTYCGVTALFLMDRLHKLPLREELIEWLVQRQGEGFQGRIGKMQDTCYGYWIGLTLQMLDALDFVSYQNFYFYQECQFEAGGFSKYPQGSPDIVHSYLGLVSVSVLGHTGLKRVYGPLGISFEACKSVVKKPIKKLCVT